MRQKVKEYGLYDSDSGEFLHTLILPVKRKVGGRWMRIFQDMAEVVSRKKLRGESYRVLWYLLSVSDFNNIVPGTGKVGEAIKIKRASVCRAYRELKETGILIEKDSLYCLSPFLAWKGNDQQLEARCRELLVPKVKVLKSG